MAIEIMAQVWARAPVDQGTLLVLLALADYAGDDRTCYPGIRSLASKSRLTDRQVQRCIAFLRAEGIVEIRRGASPVKTNLYMITPAERWRRQNVASAETTFCHPGDDMGVVSETTPMSPKPSVEPPVEPSDPPTPQEGGLFGFSADPAKGKDPQPERSAPTPPKKDPSAAEFEAFWRAYPQHRRKEKPKAAEAWRRVIAGKVKGVPATSAADLLRYLEAYTDDATVKLDYAPYPERWLTRFLFEPYTTAEPKKDYRPLVVDLMATYYVELGKISGKATISGEGRRALDMAKTFIDVERWSRPEIEEMKTEAQRRAAGSPSSHSGTSR